MKRLGLTLVEVLASTVLLTMLAAAVIPLLRDAAESHALQDSSDEMHLLLDEVAVQLQADPEIFGIDDLETVDLATIQAAVDDQPVQIQIQRLHDPDDASHTWLLLTAGETIRLMFLPNQEQAESSSEDSPQ